MASEDILDLRDGSGVGIVEVYPISTRGLTSSAWRVGGNNGPTPQAWPPETSDEWYAFLEYADATGINTEYEEGWAVGTGNDNLFFYDNSWVIYAARSMRSESQIILGMVFFDLEGIPEGTPTKVELVFGAYNFNGVGDSHFRLGVHYFPTYNTYSGGGEQPNPLPDYTSGVNLSPLSPLIELGDIADNWDGQTGHTVPYPDEEYGKQEEYPGLRWAIELAGLELIDPESPYGLRFYIEDTTGVGAAPSGINDIQIHANYNEYDSLSPTENLRESGWWLPHIRLHYGEAVGKTAEVDFIFQFGTFPYPYPYVEEELFVFPNTTRYVGFDVGIVLDLTMKGGFKMIQFDESDGILEHRAKEDRHRNSGSTYRTD